MYNILCYYLNSHLKLNWLCYFKKTTFFWVCIDGLYSSIEVACVNYTLLVTYLWKSICQASYSYYRNNIIPNDKSGNYPQAAPIGISINNSLWIVLFISADEMQASDNNSTDVTTAAAASRLFHVQQVPNCFHLSNSVF